MREFRGFNAHLGFGKRFRKELTFTFTSKFRVNSEKNPLKSISPKLQNTNVLAKGSRNVECRGYRPIGRDVAIHAPKATKTRRLL
jgi:hypothetical protein